MVNVITLNNLCSLREDKKVGILFFAISQKKGNIVWLKLTLGTSCFRLKYRHQRVTYFKSKLYVKTFLNYALCFWRYFFSLKELKLGHLICFNNFRMSKNRNLLRNFFYSMHLLNLFQIWLYFSFSVSYSRDIKLKRQHHKISCLCGYMSNLKAKNLFLSNSPFFKKFIF